MRILLLTIPAVAVAGSLVLALPSGQRWSETEVALVRSLSLAALPASPVDPSNRVADDPRAAELGRAIFFDTRFSGNGKVACATCHLPERQFQDDLPLGQGMGRTDRRTMPLAGMAHAPFLFWDGRKDSLWSQALGPLESTVEHGGDRTLYAHLMKEHYRMDYEAIFGPLPELSDLPRRAGPIADPAAATAWAKLGEENREAVNKVFANIGKAVASYERTILPPETRFDAWFASSKFPEPGILSEDEIAGLRLFVGKAECVNCHNGPLLTDNHFHNTGVPALRDLPEDAGRESGARHVLEDPFNCLGPYSDAAEKDCTELRFMAEPDHDMLRAFKTPSLRGAADRPPYMHAGQIGTLDEVLSHYIAAPAAPAGHSELRPLDLGQRELSQLKAFLQTLDPIPGGEEVDSPAPPSGASAHQVRLRRQRHGPRALDGPRAGLSPGWWAYDHQPTGPGHHCGPLAAHQRRRR
ncbi:cytochrome-c peroxidase [Jannaschia formosa]|uniref:cytochrome-c peroxidase n=1 Tax=Jannaschia formosa TaxID=2259592 RepID=UPI001ADDD0FF|nr:cytochrome c peroxidase [Jannaschia formosa]